MHFSVSRSFRGMSQPQMTHLRPDIVLIEYSDPGAEETPPFDKYVCSAECWTPAAGGYECFISTSFCSTVV